MNWYLLKHDIKTKGKKINDGEKAEQSRYMITWVW